ncbi:hypothetical protein EDB84DRAFT_1445861 [Lactarius hengduanensis]|nr:hypothetical protein EDB84DRAFT_1445861 [Lactarius hengduanensis]
MYDLVTMPVEMLKFDFTGLMIFVLDMAAGCWRLATFYYFREVNCITPLVHWPIHVIRIVMDPVVDTIFFLMGVLVLLSITRLPDGSLNTVQLALSGIIPSNALEMSTHFMITMGVTGVTPGFFLPYPYPYP